MKQEILDNFIPESFDNLEEPKPRELKVGSKITIWSSEHSCPKEITIIYIRSGVLFFNYENDVKENWIPLNSHIIQHALLKELKKL